MAQWDLELSRPHQVMRVTTWPDETGNEPDLREEWEVLSAYYKRWWRRFSQPYWDPVGWLHLRLGNVVDVRRVP